MQAANITIELVMDSYRMLASEDFDARTDANHFLMTLHQRDQVWPIAESLIQDQPDPNFQFLGAQLLYQKLSSQLESISPDRKLQLRDFAFGQLRNPAITLSATIDRLASICALLACSMCFTNWTQFMRDIFAFSSHALVPGLYVLQRLPEQLRRTNRISHGLKNTILENMLQYENELGRLFLTTLNLNDAHSTNRCLMAMASWAESRFNFLMYPDIIRTVLILSLQDFNKLEQSLNLMVEAIKGASLNKGESLTSTDPIKELSSYSQPETESVKMIVEYIMVNYSTFLGSDMEPEQMEIFSSIVKECLLGFGFLICEEIGFKLLEIIMHFTSSSDLKISRNTFEFWSDFSEKIIISKISTDIKAFFANQMAQMFHIVNKKATVSDSLLDDPDLKDDMTVDDISNMTFSEYRKDSVALYQCIFEFFQKFTGNSNYFFEECFKYIQADIEQNKLGGKTELALFCIKSAAESYVSPKDAFNLRGVIGFIIEKGSMAPPRVVAEVLLLIRDCTREIKDEEGFSLKCLEYSMMYLPDEQLSYYASDSFKCLLETFTQINDASFVDSLLNFYGKSRGLKDIIIDKVADGVISIIFKISSLEGQKAYLQKFVAMVLSRFEQCHREAESPEAERPYFLPLVEMKSVLANYDNAYSTSKKYLQEYFYEVCKNALQMIHLVIPYTLKNDYKFVLMNELGLSCTIYKYAIRICGTHIDPLFLKVIEYSFSALGPKIAEMTPLLNLLNETLVTLTNKDLPIFNEWLVQGMPYFNNFFLQYFKQSGMPDPDVIRRCYEVQESLILYNSRIFLTIQKAADIVDGSLYYLRHINEQKMQRKLINFILLCLDIPGVVESYKEKVLQTAIGSIPILHSQSGPNFVKILYLVLRAFPPESHRPMLGELLSKNPYQTISSSSLKIMIESVLFVLNLQGEEVKRDRMMMMLVRDLTELAVQGESPQSALQFEFRLSTWKREAKKM